MQIILATSNSFTNYKQSLQDYGFSNFQFILKVLNIEP